MIDLRIEPFTVPLSTPLSTARDEISNRRGFLVGIEADDEIAFDDGFGLGADTRLGSSGDSMNAVDSSSEIRGIGEATPLQGWTESSDRCRTELMETISGGSDELPSTPAARHGMTLAMLDRESRLAGDPLARRLSDRYGSGDDVVSTVPVNATIGDYETAETVSRATAAVEAGFDCLKVKVGAGCLDRDLDRLRAVRDAVGEAVTLRTDANGGWDFETADRAVSAMAEIGVSYVEQPLPVEKRPLPADEKSLPANEIESHARLRGQGVGIALDESIAATIGADGSGWSAVDRLRSVLEADAADVVIIKPMAFGGPDRAVRAAVAARDAGVEPIVTTTIDAVVARTAAVHVAATISDVSACGLATGSMLETDLAPDPAPVQDGEIKVPDGPGIAGGNFDGLL